MEANFLDLAAERGDERVGKDRNPVLRPLPIADEQAVEVEVEVLDPQPQRLEQAQTGTVEEAPDEGVDPLELREDRVDFIATENGGQADRLPRPLHVVEVGKRRVEHGAVQEDQGGQGLVLGGRRDVPLDREVGEEVGYVFGAELPRVPRAMEAHEAPDPANVRLFGTQAQVLQPRGLAPDPAV